MKQFTSNLTLKKIMLTALTVATLSSTALADRPASTLHLGNSIQQQKSVTPQQQNKPSSPKPTELTDEACTTVCALLRASEHAGNTAVQFGGSAQLTTYSVGNLVCYFQNDDDSVSCSIED